MLDKLEEQIIRLDGVISAKISLKDDGEIDEIHVVSHKSRNPKNLVRDIETLVHINLSKEIDHKKISIAQLNIKEENNSSKYRIEIISINKLYNRPICELHLYLGGLEFKKRYEGQIYETIQNLVAQTVINSLTDILPVNIQLELKNMFFTGINNEIILIELFWITINDGFIRREPLIGTAYVKNELPMAVGQALLNAINRKIHILLAD